MGWAPIVKHRGVDAVTVWYAAPTAIRMLMKAGPELARTYDTSALRFLSSVGEPLNPEAVVWGQGVFGRPFHDNWWQTETGGIMIANFAAMDVRPGWPSMFRDYLGERARYDKCFVGGFYLTGDLARRDADGYFWSSAAVFAACMHARGYQRGG